MTSAVSRIYLPLTQHSGYRPSEQSLGRHSEHSGAALVQKSVDRTGVLAREGRDSYLWRMGKRQGFFLWNV